MNKPSFAIGIPTINRADLLVPSLIKYVEDFPNTDIHVYDNGAQDIPREIKGKEIIVYGGTDNNLGVAGAWNFLLSKIYEKSQYAFILNDDIYFGKQEAETDRFILENASRHGVLLNPMDWCAFVMPQKTIKHVGFFDEKFFPAYYEDRDFERRLKLSMFSMPRLPFLVPQVYRTSQTLEKEPEKYYKTSYISKKYYIQKWGGDAGEEKFKVPFDAPVKKSFKK